MVYPLVTPAQLFPLNHVTYPPHTHIQTWLTQNWQGRSPQAVSLVHSQNHGSVNRPICAICAPQALVWSQRRTASGEPYYVCQHQRVTASTTTSTRTNSPSTTPLLTTLCPIRSRRFGGQGRPQSCLPTDTSTSRRLSTPGNLLAGPILFGHMPSIWPTFSPRPLQPLRRGTPLDHDQQAWSPAAALPGRFSAGWISWQRHLSRGNVQNADGVRPFRHPGSP